MPRAHRQSRAQQRQDLLRELAQEESLMMREGFSPSRAVEAVEALRRIQDGTYGVCVDCGKRIPAARLAIKPEATRCVACQSEQERRGSCAGTDGSFGYAQSA